MSTINNYSLDQLPNEVLLNIFSYESNDLKNIHNVCKRFKAITQDSLLKNQFINDSKLKLYKSQNRLVIFPYLVSETPNFYNYIASVLSGQFALSTSKDDHKENCTFLVRQFIGHQIYSHAESVENNKGILHIFNCQNQSSQEFKFEHEDKNSRVCFKPQCIIGDSLYLTGKHLDWSFDEWVIDKSVYIMKMPTRENSPKKSKNKRAYLSKADLQKFELPKTIQQVVSIHKDFYIGFNIEKRRLELCPWNQETYIINTPEVLDVKAADNLIFLQVKQEDKTLYQWVQIDGIGVDQEKKIVTIKKIQTLDLSDTMGFPTNDQSFISSLKIVNLDSELLFLHGSDSLYIVDIKNNRLTNTVCYKDYMQSYDTRAYNELYTKISYIRRHYPSPVTTKICQDMLLPRTSYQWPLLVISPPGNGYLQFHHLENLSCIESKCLSEHEFAIYSSKLFTFTSRDDKSKLLINQIWIKHKNFLNTSSNKK